MPNRKIVATANLVEKDGAYKLDITVHNPDLFKRLYFLIEFGTIDGHSMKLERWKSFEKGMSRG